MVDQANAFSWLMGNQTPDEQAATAANQQAMDEAALKQWEAARVFFDVFATGRGPELLMILRDATIELPLMDVTNSFVRGDVALSPSEWAYLREGQNSVVRMIERQIAIARNPAPNVSAGQQQEGDDNA